MLNFSHNMCTEDLLKTAERRLTPRASAHVIRISTTCRSLTFAGSKAAESLSVKTDVFRSLWIPDGPNNLISTLAEEKFVFKVLSESLLIVDDPNSIRVSGIKKINKILMLIIFFTL